MRYIIFWRNTEDHGTENFIFKYFYTKPTFVLILFHELLQIMTRNIYAVDIREYDKRTLSFPYFLPSPFLMSCAILPTSFGGKETQLTRWLVAQPLHQTVSELRFSGVLFGCKANARRSVHSPQDHFIITLIISDWCDTRGKWPLARNPNRSWWHRHTSPKLFWPQPLAPWTTGPSPFLTYYAILQTSFGGKVPHLRL